MRGADHADAAARHWLACHAVRVSLGTLWRDAQARDRGRTFGRHRVGRRGAQHIVA